MGRPKKNWELDFPIIQEMQLKYPDVDINWSVFKNGLYIPNKSLLDFTSKDEPHIELLKFIRKPENFYFTCKYILGVDLAPFQVVIVQKLWKHIFPMLIGSRGLSKCITGDSLVIGENGIYKISDLVNSDNPLEKQDFNGYKMLGENGFNKVAYGWNNGLTKTIKIQTRQGFQIEGTHNHPIRIAGENGSVWKNLEDLKIGDRAILDRTESWFENNNDLSPDVAYLFGLLVGDGGYTSRGHITLTSADKFIVDEANRIAVPLWGKPFNKIKSAKYDYLLCGVNIWDSLFKDYGFNSSVCSEKDFPTSVLKSSKESMRGFLQGLMDSDGCVHTASGVAEFSSKSFNLARTFHFVLTKFGIVSCLKKQYNKKYDTYYYKVCIMGKAFHLYMRRIGFRLPRKQDKYELFKDKKQNSNIDIIPFDYIFKDLFALKNGYSNTDKIKRDKKLTQNFSNYRFQSYDMTYDYLRKLLDITQPISDLECWQNLDRIHKQNYFFDEITSIEASENITYDVHIPNDHSFLSNGFISHNTYLLAVFCMLYGLIHQGSTSVITGAGFRQAKFVHDYMTKIWNGAPVLRDLVNYNGKSGSHKETDKWEFIIGDSKVVCLPIGTGDKIRGQRGNLIIAEEFGSMVVEIYEKVIAPFSAVSSSPVESARNLARIEKLKDWGKWTDEMEENYRNLKSANQSVISGTSDYEFKHFGQYWKRYKTIIEAKGDLEKLQSVMKEMEADEAPDYRDYCIIRIPVDLIPKGFMDAKSIGRSKATISQDNFYMEYGAVFPADSSGFFRRTLIEGCVCHDPINGIKFPARLEGDKNARYIMAVDPASQSDRFAIVIVELHPTHRRVVYCWTTNAAEHRQKNKKGLVKEADYYGYVARKIRDLMKIFPTELISMDSQGGGLAVMSALQNASSLKEGELPIWPIRGDHQLVEEKDRGKERPTDDEQGLHIVELVNFASADYTSMANHGLKQDMGDKLLLFPFIDTLALGSEDLLRYDEDKKKDDDFLLDDCYKEIEELKNELTSIVHTTTATGRDHWDTPEFKSANNKKGRMIKDRYSALLMANAAARRFNLVITAPTYHAVGGYVGQKLKDNNTSLYTGPEWYTSQINQCNFGSAYGR
jgi:intein/homing endonuclease